MIYRIFALSARQALLFPKPHRLSENKGITSISLRLKGKTFKTRFFETWRLCGKIFFLNLRQFTALEKYTHWFEDNWHWFEDKDNGFNDK
ncbi:MAG: hypothetical protein IPJ45_07845 [Ignavibacteria bacterium]|nr:hypothetical protein [Ignavibacteria bacterium]